MGHGHRLCSDWWREQHRQWSERPTSGTNHAGVEDRKDGTAGEIDARAHETWQRFQVMNETDRYTMIYLGFNMIFCRLHGSMFHRLHVLPL